MDKDDEIVDLLNNSIKEYILSKFQEKYWIEKDIKAEFPYEFLEMLKTLGITGLLVPENYGGASFSFLQYIKVLRHISELTGVIGGDLVMAYNIFAAYSISKFGNEIHKERYLPLIAKGEIIPSIAITEPNAGSDTFSISTRAYYDNGEYVISGAKTWITLAQLSNFMIVLTRTTEKKEESKSFGLTLFILNPKDYPNSIKISRINDIALRPLGSCEVYFDDVRVPEDSILGEKDRAWKILTKILNAERLSTATLAVGSGQLLLNKAIDYSKNRIVFGKPIGSNQAIQFPLAEGKILIEAAYKLIEEGARKLDKDEQPIFESNASAYLAANAAYKIADMTMQIFGGNAFGIDIGIEMHWRNIRLLRVGPISEQLSLSTIAHNVLGLPRSF